MNAKQLTKYGRRIPRTPGWYVDTGTRQGSGGMGLMGPFDDEIEAKMASMRAESYHREYGIKDEPHERFCVPSSLSIRYSADGNVCMVWRDGEPIRCPTQRDMDTLPVGPDMTADEVDALEF